MAGKHRISVDHTLCVGNGLCLHVAPNVFAIDDARQSQVVNPDGDGREAILEAADACPVSAITVVDAETGERLSP